VAGLESVAINLSIFYRSTDKRLRRANKAFGHFLSIEGDCRNTAWLYFQQLRIRNQLERAFAVLSQLQNLLPDYKSDPISVDPICEPVVAELELALAGADGPQRSRLIGQLGRLANQIADGRQIAVRDPLLRQVFAEQVAEIRKGVI
jgi:hypothetical protein